MVASPTVRLLAPPPITPLKVTVLVDWTAILFVPAPKVMALLMVLPVVLPNSTPPSIVTVPLERFVPLVPPVATDNTPAAIVVPPVNVLLAENTTVPLFVASPTVNAPVPAPEIMPPKVTVFPD